MNNKRTFVYEKFNDVKRHKEIVPSQSDSSNKSEVILCETSNNRPITNCNFANTSHKNCFGANNWKKFVELSHPNLSDADKNKNSPKCKNNDKKFPLTISASSRLTQENYVKLNVGPCSGNKLPGKKKFNKPGPHQATQKFFTKDNQEPVLTKHNSLVEQYNIDKTEKQNTHINNHILSHIKSNEVQESKLTKQIAMDCEMVGVEMGVNNNMLARVSLVNSLGDCIYDKYVKPTEPILDYRTHVSGIRPKDLENATDFTSVQKEVADILKGRILVGHALQNDLGVLFLTHPKREIRDTSKFRKFREGRVPALKKLAKKYLGVTIQEGEHSSVQDALAAMQLYRMFRKEWEASLWSKKVKNQNITRSRKNKSKCVGLVPHTTVGQDV